MRTARQKLRKTASKTASGIEPYLSLLQWLGVREITLSTLIALGVAVVGLFERHPAFFILVGAILAFTGALWGFAGFERLFAQYREKPGYERWDKVDVFHAWVAACLWCEQRPWPTTSPRMPSFPGFQQLKGAMEMGELRLYSGSGNMASRIRRGDLVDYAAAIGERPLFLFPEDRPKG